MSLPRVACFSRVGSAGRVFFVDRNQDGSYSADPKDVDVGDVVHFLGVRAAAGCPVIVEALAEQPGDSDHRVVLKFRAGAPYSTTALEPDRPGMAAPALLAALRNPILRRILAGVVLRIDEEQLAAVLLQVSSKKRSSAVTTLLDQGIVRFSPSGLIESENTFRRALTEYESLSERGPDDPGPLADAGVRQYFRGLRLQRVPRDPEKQHQLFGAIIDELFAPRIYSEQEVNEILGTIYDDWATLRRHLIDAEYLMRDRAGRTYSIVDRRAGAAD